MSVIRTLPSLSMMQLSRTYRERYLFSFLMSTALHGAALATFCYCKDDNLHPAEYGSETRPSTLSVTWIDAVAEQSPPAPVVDTASTPSELDQPTKPAPPKLEPIAPPSEPIKTEIAGEPAQSVAPESQPSAPTVMANAPPVAEATAPLPLQPAVTANSPSGSAVTEAKADHLRNPTPPYPRLARERGWQGTTTLHIEVLATGIPGQIRILKSSGHRILDEISVEAVRQQWKFFPARRGSVAIDSWVEQAIRFHLSSG